MNPLFERDAFSVRWLDGALLISRGPLSVLVDAPPNTDLGADAGRVQAIVLTSGRMRAIGGLLPVLASLEPYRLQDAAIQLHFPLGEERGAALTEAWVQGWPDRYPLTLDAEFPGGQFIACGLQFDTMPLRAGDPRWRDGSVDDAVAVAVRITAPEATVVWIPGAAPQSGLGRMCDGVDLAIIEVGMLDWPRTAERWRLSLTDAMKIGANAAELWVVGDDGSFGPGEVN